MNADYAYAAPASLDIDFNPPVTSGNGVLDRLSLREPTTNEVWVAEQQLTAKNGTRATRLFQRALVAKVAKVPESILDDVPMAAFTRAARYLQTFIESGLDEPAAADDETDPPKALTITMEPALDIGGVSYPSITVKEPTLGMMAKADGALGDMSAQRVRRYQETIVAMAAGGGAANEMLVAALPISVLNRLATFVMGFSSAGQAIST